MEELYKYCNQLEMVAERLKKHKDKAVRAEAATIAEQVSYIREAADIDEEDEDDGDE